MASRTDLIRLLLQARRRGKAVPRLFGAIEFFITLASDSHYRNLFTTASFISRNLALPGVSVL